MNMKCGFCGCQFDLAEASAACTGCPLMRNCHLIRCPRCGYEMPPEAKFAGWLRRLRRKPGKNSLIPPGECCLRMEEAADRLIAPLCDLRPGQQGVIAYIQMTDPRRLQKLLAIGVLPGVAVKLLRRFPSYVVEAGYCQFAVDEEIAADIYVRLARGRRREGKGKRHRRRRRRW